MPFPTNEALNNMNLRQLKSLENNTWNKIAQGYYANRSSAMKFAEKVGRVLANRSKRQATVRGRVSRSVAKGATSVAKKIVQGASMLGRGGMRVSWRPNKGTQVQSVTNANLRNKQNKLIKRYLNEASHQFTLFGRQNKSEPIRVKWREAGNNLNKRNKIIRNLAKQYPNLSVGNYFHAFTFLPRLGYALSRR